MSKFGDELVQSARQALDFAKGEAELDSFRVTAPAEIDVGAIRAKWNLTRLEFARRFGIPVHALEDWEQGRGAPDGAARVLLKIIDREPAAVERALGAGKWDSGFGKPSP